MVLLTVLLFLQIFTLVGWYALQAGFSMQLASHSYWQKNLALHSTERILKMCEEKNFSMCLISSLPRQELISKPKYWWETFGCSGYFKPYQFYCVFEQVGEDPCARINLESRLAAYYYRVSLIVFSQNDNHKEMLQSTIIKMDNASRDCKGKFHQVISGRQEWRILI